ncbi:hypothetical protein J1D01_08510 [Seonamhaeicola sp. NFXS20]|uniref:BfmA/BtgA family mobilization protein n=1 Tax=Seonamhaeicola sp. NFXS20 TaxID=2816959 RepID=UPI003B8B26FE
MKKFSTYDFSGINVKKDVAKRFRAFSKDVSKSHSETLETMLNFFKWNHLNPNDNLEVKADDTKKRINALIAIVRNIEQQQTLPTKAMLDTLFKEIAQVEQGGVEEEVFEFGTPETLTQDAELKHYQNRYEAMQRQLSDYKNTMETLLNRLQHVRNTFGKDYHKLDMDKKELEDFKTNLYSVIH